MSELSEFVEAFQAGYKLTKSKEEREWERELQKMKKEQHEWGREGDLADRAYRTEEFGFRKEQADIRRGEWRDQFSANEKYRTTVGERADRDWAQREEALQLDRERLETGGGPNTDDNRTSRAVRDFVTRPKPGDQGVDPTTTQGIPDASNTYTPETGALPVELASYQPTEQSPQAAAQTAFNLNNYLASTRSSESGGNDRAKNPKSTATGRYQFLGSTWNGLAKKYPQLGLTPDGRYDPEQQERAMMRFTYDNANSLDRAGIPITNGTLYAAHFLGDGGARKVLRANPNTPVAQLVGGDVISANPFLRGMTVADFSNWAERKGNASTRRRGNRTVSMARGGMVSAIPDDEDIQPGDEYEMAFAPEAEPAPEVAPVETALPEEGPIPTPRYEGTMQGNEEEPTDDPYEQGRRAVRDGMKYAMEQAGIRRAEREALQSPETRAAREHFAKGYGAADHQILKQVTDLIDPDRELPRSARNLRAIGTVYQFHMDQGNYEKAQAAAGQMAMALKQEALHFKAIAGAAAGDGKIDEAARAAVAAYASVPNGIDFDIEKVDDNYQVTFTDEENGEKISQQILNPREMAAAAMQLEEASFEDLIIQAAGLKVEGQKTVTPAIAGDIADNIKSAADELLNYEALVGMEVDPIVAEALEKPNNANLVRDIAQEIAAIEGNSAAPEQTLREVIGLLEVDPQVGENGERNWGAPFRFTKITGRPDEWVMERAGKEIIVKTGTKNKIEGLRARVVGESQEEWDRNQKSVANRKAAVDKFRQGANKFGEFFAPSRGALAEPDTYTDEPIPMPATPGLPLRLRPTTE